MVDSEKMRENVCAKRIQRAWRNFRKRLGVPTKSFPTASAPSVPAPAPAPVSAPGIDPIVPVLQKVAERKGDDEPELRSKSEFKPKTEQKDQNAAKPDFDLGKHHKGKKKFEFPQYPKDKLEGDGNGDKPQPQTSVTPPLIEKKETKKDSPAPNPRPADEHHNEPQEEQKAATEHKTFNFKKINDEKRPDPPKPAAAVAKQEDMPVKAGGIDPTDPFGKFDSYDPLDKYRAKPPTLIPTMAAMPATNKIEDLSPAPTLALEPAKEQSKPKTVVAPKKDALDDLEEIDID